MINRIVRSNIRLIRFVQGLYSKPADSPLFVLGNQKSGTTAIAASLAYGAGKSVTLDFFNEASKPTFQKVAEGKFAFDAFVQRNQLDFCREIIKEPHLTLMADQLVEYYPESKFLFICRDPKDNIRSILDRLKLPGDKENLERQDYQNLTKTWALIIDSSWLGVPGCTYIESLAHRWEMMMNVYAKHSERMVLVRYEDFEADRLSAVKSVATKLELALERDISAVVMTQYQPKGCSDVDLTQFFGHRNLDRIETICKSASAYDYT